MLKEERPAAFDTVSRQGYRPFKTREKMHLFAHEPRVKVRLQTGHSKTAGDQEMPAFGASSCVPQTFTVLVCLFGRGAFMVSRCLGARRSLLGKKTLKFIFS
jgi:hypothetical protein